MITAKCPVNEHCRIHIDKIAGRGVSQHMKTLPMEETMAANEPKKSPTDRVYDALTARLEPFAKRLSPEEQTELDGVVSQFSEDILNAIKTPVFLGKI